MKARLILVTFVGIAAVQAANGSAPNLIDESWSHTAPRAEIEPRFVFEARGGGNGSDSLVIEADEREGLHGYWFKSLPVQGGQHYRFTARRKTDGVLSPRRSAVARILWQDDAGKEVPYDGETVTSVLKGWKGNAEPEYPADHTSDAHGWAEVSGIYRAPAKATRARLELHLQWAPRATVRWTGVTFEPVPPPPGRKVRLAAVHFRPQDGKTPEGNARLFAPLIADAAKQRADLVVLPETLTYFGLGKSYADCAEPVPGPSTGSTSARSPGSTISTSLRVSSNGKHILFTMLPRLSDPMGSSSGSTARSRSRGRRSPAALPPATIIRFSRHASASSA